MNSPALPTGASHPAQSATTREARKAGRLFLASLMLLRAFSSTTDGGATFVDLKSRYIDADCPGVGVRKVSFDYLIIALGV